MKNAKIQIRQLNHEFAQLEVSVGNLPTIGIIGLEMAIFRKVRLSPVVIELEVGTPYRGNVPPPTGGWRALHCPLRVRPRKGGTKI